MLLTFSIWIQQQQQQIRTVNIESSLFVRRFCLVAALEIACPQHNLQVRHLCRYYTYIPIVPRLHSTVMWRCFFSITSQARARPRITCFFFVCSILVGFYYIAICRIKF